MAERRREEGDARQPRTRPEERRTRWCSGCPTLIKSWGVADLMQIGLWSALPSLIGVFGMILIGRHSDKHGERRWHFAGSVALAALGLGLTTLTQGNLGASVAALSLAVIGIASATPLFFTITTEYLSKLLVVRSAKARAKPRSPIVVPPGANRRPCSTRLRCASGRHACGEARRGAAAATHWRFGAKQAKMRRRGPAG